LPSTTFTRAWTRDLGPRGITVNVVQPGPIETDRNPGTGKAGDFQRSFIALGRYGTPDNVAEANVDGGFNA
jgi:3-oxoacyl-[acyl-carrier protein] reductase